MSRRMEVELTSRREDGTWTWRSAGAREPKGVLDGALLYPGAKAGDVVRAEAELELDGIIVTAVLAPKAPRQAPERLEVTGPRPDRATPPPPRGPGRPPGRQRPDGRRPGPPPRAGSTPPPPAAKRLRPGRAHRDALLATMAPEQQPVADQLSRGGVPGVRAALERQNRQARAEGRPEVQGDAVLAMAEDLLPRVRAADWLDRAEAALASAEDVALRDLRSVVATAEDAARDESSRSLLERLRAVLERRAAAEHESWRHDVETSLAEGRVVRALRLSSRPPQPGDGLPAELAARLADTAGSAMDSDVSLDRWAVLLDAVALSPVRQAVQPRGVPDEPGQELKDLARRHAGRVPALAALLGVEPAPATRTRAEPGRRPPRPSRPAPAPRSGERPQRRRIPPPPPSLRPEKGTRPSP